MAMTAKLWSISALAVELNMDRRTVGSRLRGVHGRQDPGQPSVAAADCVAGAVRQRERARCRIAAATGRLRNPGQDT